MSMPRRAGGGGINLDAYPGHAAWLMVARQMPRDAQSTSVVVRAPAKKMRRHRRLSLTAGRGSSFRMWLPAADHAFAGPYWRAARESTRPWFRKVCWVLLGRPEGSSSPKLPRAIMKRIAWLIPSDAHNHYVVAGCRDTPIRTGWLGVSQLRVAGGFQDSARSASSLRRAHPPRRHRAPAKGHLGVVPLRPCGLDIHRGAIGRWLRSWYEPSPSPPISPAATTWVQALATHALT